MISNNGATEFTTFSVADSGPVPIDRRTGQRYMSVLQAGKIITSTMQELCLIRNISSGGMMAEVFAPLDDNEHVEIEFKAGKIVGGIVRWVVDGRAGVEFVEKIDVHEVLAPHGGAMAPRAPRLNIHGQAKIAIGEESETVQVIDISQGGVKVSISKMLERGADVVVEIDGLPVRASVVRWVEGGYAGISFNRTMPLDQVAFWAAQQETQRGFAGSPSAPPMAVAH
jgi:hypothetical protein